MANLNRNLAFREAKWKAGIRPKHHDSPVRCRCKLCGVIFVERYCDLSDGHRLHRQFCPWRIQRHTVEFNVGPLRIPVTHKDFTFDTKEVLIRRMTEVVDKWVIEKGSA
jgi:hypothetical protein